MQNNYTLLHSHRKVFNLGWIHGLRETTRYGSVGRENGRMRRIFAVHASLTMCMCASLSFCVTFMPWKWDPFVSQQLIKSLFNSTPLNWHGYIISISALARDELKNTLPEGISIQLYRDRSACVRIRNKCKKLSQHRTPHIRHRNTYLIG